MEPKEHLREEEDKFRKEAGRKAEEEERDTEFLNGSGLEDDLINQEDFDIKKGKGGEIVRSDDPGSQEWHAREDQQKH